MLRHGDAPLARAVAALTDGGVRLRRVDIERLGWQVGEGGAPLRRDNDAPRDAGAALVDRTQAQVERFAETMRLVHDETRGFGRDLAASAETMRAGGALGPGEVAQCSGATEQRLEEATRETDELRGKLAEAQDSARRDPLTGLPDRRAPEDLFAVVSPGEARCLAVGDVDRFKDVNNRFGHAVGDRVLKAIGQALAIACAGHLVARHGGEEFAILFTGSTLPKRASCATTRARR